MFKRGMDNKGQLSVEYLLLLVVIFVVFGAMITYLIGPSIDSANDISRVSAASNAVNSIANAANLVYSNGPNSKRTLQVYIPDNTVITCNYTGWTSTNGSVNAYVTLSNGSIETITSPTFWRLDPNTYNSPGYHTVVLSWGNSNWRIQNSMT
jgi:uncharacterized protein (UPF0333 family)